MRCLQHSQGKGGGLVVIIFLFVLTFAIGLAAGIIIQSECGPDYDDHE